MRHVSFHVNMIGEAADMYAARSLRLMASEVQCHCIHRDGNWLLQFEESQVVACSMRIAVAYGPLTVMLSDSRMMLIHGYLQIRPS